MNIKWIFFDIGSTLVDEMPVYEYRLKGIADAIGISYKKAANLAKPYYNQNLDGEVELAKKLNISIPKWDSNLEEVYLDSEPCLKELSKRFNIGIIANQPLGTSKRLEKFGLLKYIKVVISSAEEGVAKPDPKIFELALQRANCLPKEAIMIGDRVEKDIIPAKKLGMFTIWLKRGYGKYWNINSEDERPNFIINDLTELPEIIEKIV